jgi:hypothetical protein
MKFIHCRKKGKNAAGIFAGMGIPQGEGIPFFGEIARAGITLY